MKMIIRMFCAVALVAGALSLTACSKEETKANKDTNGAKKVQTTPTNPPTGGGASTTNAAPRT